MINDIKAQFRHGNTLSRLILINIGVFVLVSMWEVLFYLLNMLDWRFTLFNYIAVPSSLPELAYKPWTLFTYMFMHGGILHLLLNMIILYFSGRIFNVFLTNRQLLGVYILGGLAGAVLFVLAYNIFPVFQHKSPMVGASASILAILTAAATLSPNYTVHLIFIGPVKLKYIAAFYFVISLISISSSNAGGNIAHIGGAALGYFYIKLLQRGKDMTKMVSMVVDTVAYYAKPKPKMTVAHKKTRTDEEYKTNRSQQQAQIDAILDKISKSGYDSLTKAEKDFLFKASNDK